MEKQLSGITKIIVRQDYLDLVPRLAKNDYEKLEESLRKDGQIIPIIVNQKGEILDGHTRFEICNKLKLLPIKFTVKSFENAEDEMRFVIMTNLARRQLSKLQQIELAWPLYELEKIRSQDRVNWKKNKDACVTDDKGRVVKIKSKIKEGNTTEVFGKKIGMGKTIVSHAVFIKQFAPEDILNKVRNDEMSLGAAYDLTRGKLLMSNGKKPDAPIKFCPKCKTETTSPKKTGCHVHKWFCCSHCKWGI